MPAPKKTKQDETGGKEYETLEKWMQENNKGYSSKLVSRDIEGEPQRITERMSFS